MLGVGRAWHVRHVVLGPYICMEVFFESKAILSFFSTFCFLYQICFNLVGAPIIYTIHHLLVIQGQVHFSLDLQNPIRCLCLVASCLVLYHIKGHLFHAAFFFFFFFLGAAHVVPRHSHWSRRTIICIFP